MKRSERQKVWILLLVLVCFGALMIKKVQSKTDLQESLPVKIQVEAESSTEKRMTVYITGAIASPGVYTLTRDSRVQDLVDLAGGFLSDAKTDAVNLAAVLKDGLHFHIPFIGEAEDGPININLATAEELSALDGIGLSKAQAIVDYREQNGFFSSVEDLLKVSGIGASTLEKIRKDICV